MGDHATSDIILLNDMDLDKLSLGALVPQEPCGMFYATQYQFTEV